MRSGERSVCWGIAWISGAFNGTGKWGSCETFHLLRRNGIRRLPFDAIICEMLLQFRLVTSLIDLGSYFCIVTILMEIFVYNKLERVIKNVLNDL